MDTSIKKLNIIHKNKNSGFTLIELLVVVSIIALLSTIVLAVVQDGRIKAKNTAKNNLVMEYIKALELYRNDTGMYPSHPGTPTVPKCIGYAETGDKCYVNAYDGSNTINSAISTYIKGDISHRGTIMSGTNNLNGVQYLCTNSTCNSYQLIWVLEKEISACISGVQALSFYGHRRCEYIKQ
jgi:prepilin-type N-terminal cleavage/methylation domain-containing protein